MATGSNDKMIKILAAPNIDELTDENMEDVWKDLREMDLVGH